MAFVALGFTDIFESLNWIAWVDCIFLGLFLSFDPGAASAVFSVLRCTFGTTADCCFIMLLLGEYTLLGELLDDPIVLCFNFLYSAFYFSYSCFIARALSSCYLYFSSFYFHVSESSLFEKLPEEQAPLCYELITCPADSLLANNLSWCLWCSASNFFSLSIFFYRLFL